MAKIELIATVTFGLEAVVKREIEKLGYKIIKSENAKITYLTDERGIVKSNLWLRSADRVLLKMGEFKAEISEELFQQTKAIAWEEWIPIDGKFTVNCTTVKSKLRSEPICQKTVKKAIVERLSEFYMVDRFQETGAEYTVKVTLLKDRVTLTIDTTGKGLHKRAYRVKSVAAPIKETLAASLVQLSFWNNDRVLIDPFCGSGTIAIEAAMYMKNIAPGLNRDFASEGWQNIIDPTIWKEERKAAYSAINQDLKLKIYSSDIDKKAVEAACMNAEEAGVDDCIKFFVAPMERLTLPEPYSIIICNPPYGERIGDKKTLEKIYAHFKKLMDQDETLSLYMITADKDAPKALLPREVDRRRKLYNGRIETCYYQYYGKRPPKKVD